MIIDSAALRRYSTCELGATVLEYAGTWGRFITQGNTISPGWGLIGSLFDCSVQTKITKR